MKKFYILIFTFCISVFGFWYVKGQKERLHVPANSSSGAIGTGKKTGDVKRGIPFYNKNQYSYTADRATDIANGVGWLSSSSVTAIKTVDKTTAVGGDILTYNVSISNPNAINSADATNITFTDSLDANTTYVANSIKYSPVAITDVYSSTGNVGINVPAANGVLANDNIGVPAATLAAITNGSSKRGGMVNLVADGSFTYTPPAGYIGNDTITYILVHPVKNDTGTAVIAVSDMVWFIDKAAASAGANGTLQKPFTSVAAFNAINTGAGNNAKDGQSIFIFSNATNYTEGLTLRNDQKLIGQGATATLSAITGITLPPYSYAFPSTGGTSPTLGTITGNGVALAQGNTLRGFNIGNCTASAISGNAFGTATVSELTITTNQQALALVNGTFNATIGSITSSAGTNNISLNTVGGTIAINAGSLTGATGTALDINAGNAGITYSGGITKSSAGAMISISNGNTGSLTTNTGTLSATAGTGIQLDNAKGTYSFNGTNTLNGGDAGIDILNGSAGSISFSSNTTITNPSGNAFNVDGTTAAITSNITYAGSISKNNAGYAINIIKKSIGSLDITGAISSTASSSGVNISACTGGSVNLSNSSKVFNTGANTAINLATNTGATISFTGGGLSVTTSTGIGVTATGGGTFIISGSNNVINASNAIALRVQNTTIGTGGLNFLSITAGNAATSTTSGIILNNTGATAGLTVTGTGTTAGSGGTIQNIANRGIEVISANNIVLKNMTLFKPNTADAGNFGVCDENNNGSCYAGIYLSNATTVSLSYITIDSTEEQGINANNVTDLTIDNCTLTHNGKPSGGNLNDDQESALKFRDIKGNCNITNSSFSFSEHRIAHIINTAGNVRLVITNSSFLDNKGSSLGQDCFEMRTRGTSTATVIITNSNFRKATTKGIQIFAEESSTITLAVTGCNIDRQNTQMAGVEVGADNTATMNANVDNNPIINGSGEVALNVYSGTSSFSNATIRNNPSVQSNPTTNYAFATLRTYVDNSAQSKVLISGNALSNTDQQAILVHAANGSGRIDATVQSNTITTPNLPASNEGIEVRVGSTTSTYANTNCANVKTNTVTVLGTGRAFRARAVSPGTTVRLQGNAGSPPTVINLWNNNGNTLGNVPSNANPVIASTVAGSTLTYGTDATNTCALPTNLIVASRAALPDNVATTKDSAAASLKNGVSTAVPDSISGSVTAKNSKSLNEINAVTDTIAAATTDSVASVNSARTFTSTQNLSSAISIAQSGGTITVTGITLPAGKTISIQLQATVNNPFPLGICSVSNQGSVSGDNITTVLTDNDGNPANGINPTVTSINTPPVITACQSNITANTDANTCTSSQSFSVAVAGCPAPVVTYTLHGTSTVITSPYVFPTGITTVDVIASNGISPDATCSFTVTVNAIAPGYSQEPSDTSICIGNPASFTTSATGTNLSYQWQENTGSGFANITNGGVYTGAQAAVLNISAASISMNGYRYQCVITSCNSASVTTDPALLTVNPVIASNSISGAQSVCSGSSPATLTGSSPSGGDGTYLYSWEMSTTSATSGFSAISNTNTKNYSPGPVSTVTWFRRVVSSGGCADISGAIQVSITDPGTWTGITSADWNTASNWCGGVPTASTNITIPSSAPNMPAITTNNMVANNIEVQTGATLSLTSGSLTINGVVTGTGLFIGSNAANLTISGTAGGSVGTLNFAAGSRNLNSLTLDRTGASAAATIGTPLSIYSVLTISNGTLNTGDSVIFKSTATSTARLAPVTGSGTISGTVILERYIPSHRAWRLMTTPLTNANTIREAWQNNGVYTPGTGTFITGPGGTSGLDNGNTYSLKTYDVVTQQLLPVANTNQSLSSTNGSADNKGYFLFVRGDRDPANLTPPNSNVTTLRSRGNLQLGTQTFAASSFANNYTLIGNPYASPVDFSLVTRNNLAKRFYAWDPALNTVGGYVLLDDVDNDGNYSVAPASTQTNIVQPSQAFFVQTISTAPASVTFNESNKSTVTTNAGFRSGNGTSEVLRTSLYLKNNDAAILADGVLTEFNNNYSKLVNIEDGPKMENINENLALKRDGYTLSLERRPLVDVNDTLFLHLTNTTVRNYQLKFEPSNFSPVVSAWLEDTYLNTLTPVSVTEPTIVDFSVTANTLSGAPNRFRIVFKANTTLSANNTTLHAYEQNAGIQVDWKVARESNMSRYEVEKSLDGYEFKKVGTVPATGNNNAEMSYNLFDQQPLNGNNFYRIKGVNKSGEITYSVVVNVKIGYGKPAIVVYPNPVPNRTINLQLNNEPKGTYIIQLFNTSGQQLMAKTIKHPGGSATQTIGLHPLVSKGVYQLYVSNGDNKINQQIIVQ